MEIESENYTEAGRRHWRGAEHLFQGQHFGSATHLYGLVAECALKACMNNLPGGERAIPRRHLPDLVDDAKLWLKGKRHLGIIQLLNKSDYMAGWQIDNRYWPDASFSREQCEQHRAYARRTLSAARMML